MAINLDPHVSFVRRHIGPDDHDVAMMLRLLGATSLEEFVAQALPSDIRLPASLSLPPALTEAEVLEELRALAARN